MGGKGGNAMKHRITAVRVAGAKPSFDDTVLSTTTFYRLHQKITTVRDARISLKSVPTLIRDTIERITKNLQEVMK